MDPHKPHPTDALVERLRQACQPIADMEILTSNPVDEDIAIVSMRTVLAIRAALSAMPEPAEPVAWMYEGVDGAWVSLRQTKDALCGLTETPLYKAPPPPVT